LIQALLIKDVDFGFYNLTHLYTAQSRKDSYSPTELLPNPTGHKIPSLVWSMAIAITRDPEHVWPSQGEIQTAIHYIGRRAPWRWLGKSQEINILGNRAGESTDRCHMSDSCEHNRFPVLHFNLFSPHAP